MSQLSDVIEEEIQRDGPMRFSRFMDLCLYHPQLGYYRSDRFGTQGDFYTAEQVQPVFGRLIASYLRKLVPDLRTVVELGAGRREMEEALGAFEYIPVDVGYSELPSRTNGVIFSNEFFDALPVDLLVRKEDGWFERRVGTGLRWDDSTASEYTTENEDTRIVKLQHERIRWMRRIAESLDSGAVVTIDYGYTQRELVRFPEGTLMSYRRHTASDDVLSTPGERDITAHVDFTALQKEGEKAGLRTVRFESLASALLYAGEDDNFESALQGGDLRSRLQLKNLLFGMGETFRVLVQAK